MRKKQRKSQIWVLNYWQSAIAMAEAGYLQPINLFFAGVHYLQVAASEGYYHTW